MPQHDDPLAGYTPGWQDDNTDLLAGYSPDWRTQQTDPLADYTPQWRDDPNIFQRAVGKYVAGIKGFGIGLGQGAMRLSEAITKLHGAIIPGEDPFERGSSAIRESRERFEERTAPQTGWELGGQVTGNILFEGAQYLGGGALVKGGARVLGGAYNLNRARKMGALGKGLRRFGGGSTSTGVRGALGEAGRDVVAMAPVDALVTSLGPEYSMAGAAAGLTGSETARRIAENPYTRFSAEVATGGLADVALRGIGAGVRGVQRLAGRAGSLTRAVAEGLNARPLTEEFPAGLEVPPDILEQAVAKGAITDVEASAALEGVSATGKQARDRVTELLGSKGYDGIQYENVAEDVGSMSYMVFDPANLRSRAAAFDPENIGRPDLMGGASAGAVRVVAGAGVGAVTGAAIDDEQPMRGAAIGGLAGLGIGARGLRGTRPTRPAYLASDAVGTVLETVSKDSALNRMTATGRDLANHLFTRVSDEAAPLKDFGRKVEGTEDLAFLAANAKGYRGAARIRLRDEFTPVIEAARGHEEGVNALTKAQRALELLDAGLEKTDIPRETLEQTVRELSAIPEVMAGADALRGYYRSLLDHKLANGVLDQEAYDAIIESGEFYVPFLRDFEEAGVRGGMGGEGQLLSGRTGIRKMDTEKASAKTVDPFVQAIQDTMETERRVAKQRVTNMVSEIVERNPEAAAPFLREIPNNTTPKHGRAVQANIGGKRKTYEVLDQELYDAWASFEPYTGNIFVRVFSYPKRALQAGVTAMADFMARNAIRDNAMSAIQYPFNPRAFTGGAAVGGLAGAAVDEEDRLRGALTGAVIGSGVAQLARNYAKTLNAMRDIIGPKLGGDPEMYSEWMREGGSGFGFYSNDAKSARRVLDELQKQGVSAGDLISPRSWWEGLQTIGRTIEEAPRLARYKYMREQGVEIPEAIFESRDLSLDFMVIGKHMKGVAATNAFMNAQIQGWGKLARLLKKKQTWALGASMITAPSIALWTINKDNEAYWDIPLWQRNIAWHIPKAPGHTGSPFYVMPKPFEIGLIFATVPERILDYAYRRDPEALMESLKGVVSTYGPGSLLPLTTLARPLIENVADYSFFRDRPVNPEQYTNIPEEMQFTDRTSSVAVGAGRLTGRSPAKIENVIRSWTGGLGGAVLAGSSRAARNIGLDDRPAPVDERLPVVGRFLTRASQVSERELTIRRRFRKVDALRNALRRIEEGGDDDKAQAYYARHSDQLEQYDLLKGLHDEVREASSARRLVRESDLPDDQKKAVLIQINHEIAQSMDSYLQRGGPLLGGNRRELRASPDR